MRKCKISRRSFLLALSAVFLCACATPDTEETSSVPADSNTANATPTIDPNAVTGALCIYLERAYASELTEPLIWQAIEAFQMDYPNITLTFESPVGGSNDYESREADITRLETQIIAGGGPDVFLFGYDDYIDCKPFPDLDKAMQNGAFLDCSEWLLAFDTDVFGDEFWQVVMETGRIENAQYFIPLSFQATVAIGAQNTIASSGLDTAAAMISTTAFTDELARVYAQNNNYTTLFSRVIVANLATPVMDYDTNYVRLDEAQVKELFLLEQSVADAVWNQGANNFTQEFTQTGEEQFYAKETIRLASGERLFYLNGVSTSIYLLWQMAAKNITASILPLPNEYGTATAVVDSCVSINANTKNELAASLFVAYLLSAKAQNNAAYPTSIFQLPIRIDSLASAANAFRAYMTNLWWMNPTDEKIALWEAELSAFTGKDETFTPYADEYIAAYNMQYGEPLTEDMVADLHSVCEHITAAHLETIFSKSIKADASENADDIITSAYNQFTNGDISYDEMEAILTPRLQLYLDE